MSAAEIYARQLSKKKEGFPLWEPDPGEDPAVEIADVGYTRDGAFIRLFNASKEEGDPSNDLGVPAPYAPLHVGRIQRKTPLPPGLIKSESVSGHTVEVALEGGQVVQAGGGFSFRCEDQQGAVLILGDFAYRQDARSRQRFLEYIRTHHRSWLAFANNAENASGIALEDLVLVTGCDKTSAWACAAFSDKSRDSSISFQIGQGIVQGKLVWGRWEENHAEGRHSGPQRLLPPDSQTTQLSDHHIIGAQEIQSGNEAAPAAENAEATPSPQFNQCVLLRGYRFCDRATFYARKIRVASAAYDGLEYVTSNLFSGPKNTKSLTDSSQSPTLDASSGQRSSPPSDHLAFARDDETKDTNLSEFFNISRPTEQVNPAILVGPDAPSALDSEELDIYLQLNHDKEPTLLDYLLYYILETSDAQLAIVHDEDLNTVLQDDTDVDNFERWLRKLAPKVYINDEKVGMLEATYHLFTSDLKASDKPILAGLDIISGPPFNDYGLPDLTGQVERMGEYPSDGGGHADIYIGEWLRSTESQKVVVRVLRQSSSPKVHQRQLEFMHEWIKFDHQNILLLYGVCRDFSPLLAAISPSMRYGNIVKYLEQQGASCTLPRRLHLLSGVASALHYLHTFTPKIIHCDVKGLNVLVSEDFEGILGGFGNSRLLTYEDQEDEEANGQAGGSMRWMAPELLATEDSGSHRFSAMTDVFAFGCLILQVVSGQIPWFTIKSDISLPLEIIRMRKPPVPAQTYLPMEIERIMEDCWSDDVHARPSMDTVTLSISMSARKLADAGVPPPYSRIQSEPVARHFSPPPPFTQSFSPQSTSSGISEENLNADSESVGKGKKKAMSPHALVTMKTTEFVAELSSVPRLAPILGVVREIIEVCMTVHSNRAQTKQLQERCRRLVIALSDEIQGVQDFQSDSLIAACVRQLTQVLAIVSKWSPLNRWESFMQSEAISEDIKKCHLKIDDCGPGLQLDGWRSNLQDAKQEDHAALLKTLSELKEDNMETPQTLEAQAGMLLELLQTHLRLSTRDSDQYHALEKSLYEVQKRSGELPPDINLKAGEARRIGKFPVGGNAAFDIWEGIWLGNEKVALKTIRGVHIAPETQKRFTREAIIWREVWSKDRGHHILPFYGACFLDGPYPYMVSPWMKNGDVMQYLEKYPTADRLRIIKGIANGLSLLHNMKPRPVTHGDSNVLISDAGEPLLADFGLSKILEDITGVPFTQSKGVSESYRWFAPELCTAPGVLSTYSDVFAYAMTVVEIMTGRPPFAHIKRTTEVLIEMQRGARPQRPTDEVVRSRGLDDHIWDVLTRCWKGKPEERLTIDEVLGEL